MLRDHLESLSLDPVFAPELPDALRLLFANLDAQQRGLRTAEILAEFDAADGKKHILLAARRGQRLVAVAWLQIRPGRVGALHPPALVPAEPEETAVELIELAVSQATLSGVRFVQALLKTDAGPEARCLQRCGFQHLTDLLYLVCPRESFPPVKLPSRLEFHPLDESAAATGRLAAIIEATYQGSQDCPAIHGLQPIGDALASYRATGQFDPSRWFIVRSKQSDVGCLLLIEHPISSSFPIPHSANSAAHWELIYMGLIPEMRGRGLGVEIARHAQWLASQAAAERLVLAVDAANAPAIAVYSAAGFQTWDRRSVFLRTK